MQDEKDDFDVSKQREVRTANVPPSEPAAQSAPPIRDFFPDAQVASVAEKIRGAEKWMIWLTAAIAFSGVCSIGVGLLQWSAIKGQLKEMRNGASDTHALAAAAGKQADAAKATAESTKDLAERSLTQATATNKLATAADESAEQARRQADAAQRSAAAAIEAAKRAEEQIKVSEKTLRFSERAWVSAEPVPVTDKLGLTGARIVFRNTGRSPARNIKIHTDVRPLRQCPPGDSPLPFSNKGSDDVEGVGVLQPGQTGSTQQANLSLHEMLVNLRTYAFGVITYDDIFDERHVTEFSFYFSEAGKMFLLCPTHNRAE